jgi:hypothetical protein
VILRRKHRLWKFLKQDVEEDTLTEDVGGWEKLHKAVIHNLFSSQDIRIIKSDRMRVAGYGACMRVITSVYGVF